MTLFIPAVGRYRARLRFIRGPWRCWRRIDDYPEGRATRLRFGPIILTIMATK